MSISATTSSVSETLPSPPPGRLPGKRHAGQENRRDNHSYSFLLPQWKWKPNKPSQDRGSARILQTRSMIDQKQAGFARGRYLADRSSIERTVNVSGVFGFDLRFFDLLYRRDECLRPVNIIPEHIETCTGGRHQYCVSRLGKRKALSHRIFHCRGVMQGHSSVLYRSRDLSGIPPDQHHGPRVLGNSFRQRREILPLAIAPGY